MPWVYADRRRIRLCISPGITCAIDTKVGAFAPLYCGRVGCPRRPLDHSTRLRLRRRKWWVKSGWERGGIPSLNSSHADHQSRQLPFRVGNSDPWDHVSVPSEHPIHRLWRYSYIMDAKVVQEMLDELFSALEALETQNSAILQFLKSRDIARDEDFAPFFEEASHASNVRWRATRIRVNHLLANASKANEVVQEKSSAEKDKDQSAIQQPPEQRRDSEDSERTAERTEEDSRFEKDKAAPPQNSDSHQGVAGSTVDRLANKDAA